MLHTLLLIHSALVLVLIIVILLQRSESGALSGLAGGSSGGGVFTARGGKNFMTRLTAILATGFIISSLVLAMLSKREHAVNDGSLVDDIIREEQEKGILTPTPKDAPSTTETPSTPSVPLAQ
jgi:preprotein translocase subunit SecG